MTKRNIKVCQMVIQDFKFTASVKLKHTANSKHEQQGLQVSQACYTMEFFDLTAPVCTNFGRKQLIPQLNNVIIVMAICASSNNLLRSRNSDHVAEVPAQLIKPAQLHQNQLVASYFLFLLRQLPLYAHVSLLIMPWLQLTIYCVKQFPGLTAQTQTQALAQVRDDRALHGSVLCQTSCFRAFLRNRDFITVTPNNKFKLSLCNLQYDVRYTQSRGQTFCVGAVK